jgi:biotin transport system substrate-specific component
LSITAGVASVLGGIIVIYGFGIAGMSIVLDKTLIEATLLVTAFIPGDLIKAIVAGAVTAALYKARPNSVLSRA